MLSLPDLIIVKIIRFLDVQTVKEFRLVSSQCRHMVMQSRYLIGNKNVLIIAWEKIEENRRWSFDVYLDETTNAKNYLGDFEPNTFNMSIFSEVFGAADHMSCTNLYLNDDTDLRHESPVPFQKWQKLIDVIRVSGKLRFTGLQQGYGTLGAEPFFEINMLTPTDLPKKMKIEIREADIFILDQLESILKNFGVCTNDVKVKINIQNLQAAGIYNEFVVGYENLTITENVPVKIKHYLHNGLFGFQPVRYDGGFIMRITNGQRKELTIQVRWPVLTMLAIYRNIGELGDLKKAKHP